MADPAECVENGNSRFLTLRPPAGALSVYPNLIHMAASNPLENTATAKAKFHCPACGAEATWNPTKQALVCAFCNTVSPAKLTEQPGAGGIVEHDLVAALRGIPDDARGWQAERTSVRCQSCQAISVFDATKVGQRCEFCGSASLVPYEQVKDAFRPESLLPLKISEVQVREQIREWYRQRWFAPGKLGTKAMTDTVHGVYLPYWTFDAHVQAQWQAESGYYYYETESYRDANGNLMQRQVQRTRWQHSSGAVTHFFDDQIVNASKGINAELLAKIEPFPTQDLVPYSAGYLAGWTVERYQIDLIQAAKRSRETMEVRLRELIARQIPGDTYRNLHISANWSGQTFKHILAPVWLLTYDYHGRAFQVVINGYTGSIAGKHPISAWKVILLIVGILMVIGLVLLVTQRG